MTDKKYDSTLDVFATCGPRGGRQPMKDRTRNYTPELSGRKDGDGSKAPKHNTQPTEGSNRYSSKESGNIKNYLDVGPEGQKGREPSDNVQSYGIRTGGSAPRSNRQPTEK